MSSAEGNNTDYVTTREFQNFRVDVKEEFKEVHKCTERIEGKVDEIKSALDPILEEFRDKQKQRDQAVAMRWDVKKAVVASMLGIAGSVVTTVIIVLVGLH